jgi:probable addiction module antidote protein
MPKNKIRYDNVYKAREMYAVLIDKERESRSYPKKEMLEDLIEEDLYCEFLKTCFELDNSDSLEGFRKALYLVLNQIGMSKASKETGIPRTTLYRMLWKDGNPNLKYLVKILEFLNLSLWVVSNEFVNTAKTKRYKNVSPTEVIGSGGRRIRTPKQIW